MARVFTANLNMASGSKWGELRLDITPGTQNIANNTTEITYELYLQRTATNFGGYYSNNTSTAALTINGTSITVSNFTYNFGTVYKKSLKTGSMTIKHGDDGTKSISASASVAPSGNVPNGSGSGNLALTTIARASTFTLGGATNTNANITVSISRKSDDFRHGVWYKVGSGDWVTVSSSATTSASFSVQPSELLNLKSAVVTVAVQTKNGSTNIGAEIHATRTITIPNSTVSISGAASTGSEQTAEVSNSGGSGLTYTYAWSLAGTARGSNASTYTPSHSHLPNAASGTLTCTVTTKNGTAEINKVSATRAITVPADVIPTISKIAHSEQDSTTEGLGLTAGKYVQGKSKVKVTVTAAAGSGASISGYTIKVDGQTATGNNAITGVIRGSGTLAITATVTDSRGRSSSTTSQNITVLPYTQPYLSGASAYRASSSGANDPFGTYSRAKFTMNAASLDGKNTLAYQVLTSEVSGASSASRVSVAASAGNIGKTITTDVFGGFTLTKEYQYTVILTDKYGIYTIKTDALYIPTAGVNLAVGHGGVASSFGKLASHGTTYDLEIGNKGIRVDGPIQGSDGLVHSNAYADTRSVNNTPEWYQTNKKRQIVREFKTKSTIGLGSASGSYIDLSTHVFYGDPSGGTVKQVAIDNDGSIYTRTGAGSSSSWGSWTKLGDVDVLNKVYPVGAIYISAVNTNPGTLFGGTWAAFATGRTIVGVDTGQTEFNTVQKTGGHKSMQSHTHTITVASGGAHTHTVSGTAASAGAHTHDVESRSVYAGGDTFGALTWLGNSALRGTAIKSAGAHTHRVSGTAASGGAHSHTATAASSGSGNAENLQPYITVYMWRRTA